MVYLYYISLLRYTILVNFKSDIYICNSCLLFYLWDLTFCLTIVRFLIKEAHVWFIPVILPNLLRKWMEAKWVWGEGGWEGGGLSGGRGGGGVETLILSDEVSRSHQGTVSHHTKEGKSVFSKSVFRWSCLFMQCKFLFLLYVQELIVCSIVLSVSRALCLLASAWLLLDPRLLLKFSSLTTSSLHLTRWDILFYIADYIFPAFDQVRYFVLYLCNVSGAV